MDEEPCNECGNSHVVWANISVFEIKYNDIYIVYQVIKNMKRIVHYVKITTLLYNYWYFIVATWLGFYLGQLTYIYIYSLSSNKEHETNSSLRQNHNIII